MFDMELDQGMLTDRFIPCLLLIIELLGFIVSVCKRITRNVYSPLINKLGIFYNELLLVSLILPPVLIITRSNFLVVDFHIIKKQ